MWVRNLVGEGVMEPDPTWCSEMRDRRTGWWKWDWLDAEVEGEEMLKMPPDFCLGISRNTILDMN